MKKINLVSLILAIALLLTSCGASGSFKAVSMYDLSKAMTGACSTLAEMKYASSSDDNAEDELSNVIDEDYSKIDSFFLSYAASGVDSCDEIAVIAVKDASCVSEVEQMLKDHVDYRISLYRTYGASMVPKLEKAEVFTSGNYAVLIVADDTAAIKTAFENFIAAQ